MSGFFRVAGGHIELDLKVTPQASANRIQEPQAGRLRVYIAAAPEDGKANAALTAFLAKTLSVRKSEVRLKSGETSRLKTVIVPLSAQGALEAAGGVGAVP